MVQCVGLSRATWATISARVGNLPHMRVLAMMSIYLVHSAITDLRIGLLDADTGRSALDDNGNPATRALSMAESVQAGYCFRICRSAFGLLHIDVLDKFFLIRALDPTVYSNACWDVTHRLRASS